MNAPSLKMTVALTALAALVLAGSARSAHAGDVDDTVFLDNGGRLRGVVVEESPSGVKIKLADGTFRTVQRAHVKQIVYGQPAPAGASPAPAPAAPPGAPPLVALPPAAPDAAPALPRAAPVPAGWRYAPEGAPGGTDFPRAPRTERRNKALMITGIVMMPVGAVALLAGGALCGVASSSGLSCASSDTNYADAIMMVTGGTMLLTGVIFTAIGAPRVPVVDTARKPPPLQLGASVGPRSVALVGLF